MYIYTPFKCKIKLSWQELRAVSEMLGRVRHGQSLECRALIEWSIKKRMEYIRKLMSSKKEYIITLNAQDAHAATTILGNAALHDEYERVLAYKIEDQVARLM